MHRGNIWIMSHTSTLQMKLIHVLDISVSIQMIAKILVMLCMQGLTTHLRNLILIYHVFPFENFVRQLDTIVPKERKTKMIMLCRFFCSLLDLPIHE